MISLKIPEVKIFMAKLLTQNVFDAFLLKEMELATFTSFTISGQFHEAFFTKEELEERGENRATLWSDVRAIAFAMIKGNKTPLTLKIVFQLPKEQTEKVVERLAGRLRPEEVGGLYMNVRFEKDELHIITGTAIKTFTLDKTLEQEWDKEVRNILRQQGILIEEEW
ncbi:MAG: hypothetical protein E7255_02990 [Lachnospiraceae bacterium]|jgi:hypothetical protein|nr:hypothetical protein [Lachnospiraceae bacterium]